jgi:hypothetical protein
VNGFFSPPIVLKPTTVVVEGGIMSTNNRASATTFDRGSFFHLARQRKTTPDASTLFALGKKKQILSVDDIAIGLGLNVVPKPRGSKKETSKGSSSCDVSSQSKTKRKKKKKNAGRSSQHTVPTIIWGESSYDFFWGASANNGIDEMDGGVPVLSSLSTTDKQWIANHEGFPLYLLQNVLSSKALKEIQSIVMNEDKIRDANEIEQHELVKGEPHALRRSLVSRLVYDNDPSRRPYDNEILDRIFSELPNSLVSSSEQQQAQQLLNDDHPYEDGSIVYYRNNGQDFYNTHHDSYDPDDPPRKRQRAYTILLYLDAPRGNESSGGTEFPLLTPLLSHNTNNNNNNDNKEVVATTSRETTVIVKPKNGEALVWPNFDQDGKPYMDSMHRALSIKNESKMNRGNGVPDIEKVVVNVWFEGMTQHKP